MIAVVLGVYWTFQPALVQPFLRKITGNDNIALGHTSASVALLAVLFGKLLGNKTTIPRKSKYRKGSNFFAIPTSSRH